MLPNLERLTLSDSFAQIKAECLDQMISIGQASLPRAIGEYVAHYLGERDHQGLENRLIRPAPKMRSTLHPFIAAHDFGERSIPSTVRQREASDRFVGHYVLDDIDRLMRRPNCVSLREHVWPKLLDEFRLEATAGVPP